MPSHAQVSQTRADEASLDISIDFGDALARIESSVAEIRAALARHIKPVPYWQDGSAARAIVAAEARRGAAGR